jgi:hypothetical protein
MLHSGRDCFGITRHRFSPRGHPSCRLGLLNIPGFTKLMQDN